MYNYSKHFDNYRTQLVRVVTVLMFAVTAQILLAAGPAEAAAPAESPGCETYGCVYEHCLTHFSRGGDEPVCPQGIAYEMLPEGGPDNRAFVEVLWPGQYDPARRAMWDQVAFCESTWRWGYNGGSGFDGGLQFTPSTWRAYGGTEYAGYAWQATPEQQVDVAERVAFLGYGANGPQGRGAWPNCGHFVSPPSSFSAFGVTAEAVPGTAAEAPTPAPAQAVQAPEPPTTDQPVSASVANPASSTTATAPEVVAPSPDPVPTIPEVTESTSTPTPPAPSMPGISR